MFRCCASAMCRRRSKSLKREDSGSTPSMNVAPFPTQTWSTRAQPRWFSAAKDMASMSTCAATATLWCAFPCPGASRRSTSRWLRAWCFSNGAAEPARPRNYDFRELFFVDLRFDVLFFDDDCFREEAFFFDADFFAPFFGATFAPERRASLRAMAMACFRFLTFFLPPDLSWPCLYSCMTFPTFFCALRDVLRGAMRPPLNRIQQRRNIFDCFCSETSLART